jgi:lipoate-protein ligase B
VAIDFLHPIAYADAWTIQQHFHTERVAERRRDTLLLLEHRPVFTMGRRTAASHIPGGEESLRKTGMGVQFVNRGGSITYHGPGQLIGYPIMRLAHFATGPKKYVWLLEEVLIRTLALWEVEAYRIDKQPGLFVQSSQHDAKIASIGVRVDRGITLHGFALNVDLDLTPFSSIVACGLTGCHTTSLATVRHESIPLALVKQQVAEQFAQIFQLTWQTPSEAGDHHLASSVQKC